MSRCFPFPPPGYEPKYRIEDIDILKKEKLKEKKHKKEKDKKREGKEKRDKERSDGKHKERKEKKEKHKENRKEKEKRKDKHKDSTSDEKRLQGHSEGQSEERIYNEKQLPGHIECSDGKKIIKKDDGLKEKISLSVEKRSAGNNRDGKNCNNSHLGMDKVSRSVQEFGKITKGGTIESRNQLGGKISGTGHSKDGVRLTAKPSETCVDEKSKGTRVDDRQIEGRGFNNQTGNLADTAVQNLSEIVQTKTEGVHLSPEKYTKKMMEKKEKKKENGGGNKCGDARIKREGNKEKPKENNGQQHQVQRKPKESGDCGLSGPRLAKDSKRSAVVDGNAKKRKEVEANGFLHVEDNRPSKVPRPPPHSSTQNGSSLKDGQNAISSISKRDGVATNITVRNEECYFNGVQEAPPLSSCPIKHLPATVQNCNIVENNVNLPHPDLKYLSQVLSVPEAAELPDIDDGEWLFSSSHVKSEKPEENSHATPQVWAEALRIDSDDFFALPYVIPY